MSSEPAIAVRGLGKTYTIQASGTPHGTLAEAALGWLRAPRARRETFWALREIDFTVDRGEVVGLIGPNGAGKSTLLKLLSRITEPSAGEIALYGRVGSLLEVGSGFHPELTGRENIFVNGAVLGMTRREIRARFEEIVAFADVERFLDTPVKRYSSGMSVRLAFAVAAHLDLEILIVDEVLAVGDAAFQKRCLSKMQEVARGGRTVFFVSHHLAAVSGLCSRGLLLSGGRLSADGPIAAVVTEYQRQMASGADGDGPLDHVARRGSGAARFTRLTTAASRADGSPLPLPYPGSDLLVRLEIRAESEVRHLGVGLRIADRNGYPLIEAGGGPSLALAGGETALVAVRLRDLRLRPDLYSLSLWLAHPTGEEVDVIDFAAPLEIGVDPEGGAEIAPASAPYACRFEIARLTPEETHRRP